MNDHRSVQPLPVRRTEKEFFAGLEHMLSRPAPFLSCFLPVASTEEVAESRQAIDRAQPGPAGSEFAHAVIDQATAKSADEQASRMAVAIRAGDGSTYLQQYPEGEAKPFVESAPLPRLAPLIEAEQRLRHHLLIIASEEGLDVLTFPRHGRATSHTAGATDMDRRVELVLAAAEQTETRLAIITGAPAVAAELARRLQLVLPNDVVIETVAEAGSEHQQADAVVESVANERAKEVSSVLSEWSFERSRGNAAADVSGAVEALRSGTARLLLIHDDVSDERLLLTGEDPRAIATDLDDAQRCFTRSGVSSQEMVVARLADALLRSAILQGVSIRIVPGSPDERLPGGVGVLYQESREPAHGTRKTA